MAKSKGVTLDLTEEEIQKFQRIQEKARKAIEEMNKMRGTEWRINAAEIYARRRESLARRKSKASPPVISALKQQKAG